MRFPRNIHVAAFGVAATRPRGISTGPRLVSPAGQGKTFIKVTHTTTKQTAYLSDAEFTMVLQMLQDEKLQLVMSFESHEEYFSPRVDLPKAIRGDAVAATWTFGRDRRARAQVHRLGRPRSRRVVFRAYLSLCLRPTLLRVTAGVETEGGRSAALRGVDVVTSQVPIVLF